jgi:hypothetical protein
MSAHDSTSTIKSVARAAGLTKLYRMTVRRPLNTIRQSIREGGPIEQWRTAHGKSKMIESVASLPQFDPPSQPSSGQSLKVHFLTGEDYWYQTLYCFLSLQRFCTDRITPVLYSDGSPPGPYWDEFQRVVPWADIRGEQETEERIQQALPPDKYSLLHEWRHDTPPLLRKLVDLHAGSSGWKLLLDSDMLFFRRPDFLIEWLRCPSKPCFMVDVSSFYSYSSQLRYELVEYPIPEAVNIGILGLKSGNVDFDRMQEWLEILIEEEGAKYPLDQPLCSLMLAGCECEIAPPDKYVVLPSLEEGRNPSSVLHHYVAESKRPYFQYGWRHVRKSLDEEGISPADSLNQ